MKISITCSPTAKELAQEFVDQDARYQAEFLREVVYWAVRKSIDRSAQWHAIRQALDQHGAVMDVFDMLTTITGSIKADVDP